MKFTFRNIAIINALVLFIVAIIWMFVPNLFLSLWGVEYSYDLSMFSRRGAAAYAGVSVMLFFARNAQPSQIRSALVTGVVVACTILAALGVMEFVTSHARIGILTSALIEIAIAMSLWYANKEKTAA